MTGGPHQRARRTARQTTRTPDLTPVQILENGSIHSLPKNAAAGHIRLPVSSRRANSIRGPTRQKSTAVQEARLQQHVVAVERKAAPLTGRESADVHRALRSMPIRCSDSRCATGCTSKAPSQSQPMKLRSKKLIDAAREQELVLAIHASLVGCLSPRLAVNGAWAQRERCRRTFDPLGAVGQQNPNVGKRLNCVTRVNGSERHPGRTAVTR
jgi:hypothetical protein